MSEQAILERLNDLEGEAAIRRLVARYFAICDDLGPDTPFQELGELFSKEALWEGKGRYAKAFGRYEGRPAIVAMIRSYCEPTPHFAMTAHFFSSENLTASGDTGSGQWMMLQTTDYADGTADFRSARLTMEFTREGGAWRIAHFRTENIFSRQVEPWNDEENIAVPDHASSGAEK
jgi:hypothetical protein